MWERPYCSGFPSLLQIAPGGPITWSHAEFLPSEKTYRVALNQSVRAARQYTVSTWGPTGVPVLAPIPGAPGHVLADRIGVWTTAVAAGLGVNRRHGDIRWRA